MIMMMTMIIRIVYNDDDKSVDNRKWSKESIWKIIAEKKKKHARYVVYASYFKIRSGSNSELIVGLGPDLVQVCIYQPQFDRCLIQGRLIPKVGD